MNPFDTADFLATSGLAGLCVLLFVETGVLIGFIFPGDSVLFTAGVFSSMDNPFAPLWKLMVFLPLAAALGDQCGYLLGRYAGPRVLQSPVLGWIGSKPVDKTQQFFDKYGVVTILFARFIGIVRTLAPLTAGLSKMNYPLFSLCSITGSILWASGLVFLGNKLGAIPLIQDNISIIIMGSIATIVIPTAFTIWSKTVRDRTENSEDVAQHFTA